MNKKIYVGIILSVIISGLVLFAYSATLNKNIILHILKSISLSHFIFAIILTIFSFVFDGIKHYIVFRNLGQKITLTSAINSCFITAYFSAVTPFSVGGQPFQILYLNKKGVKSSYATQVVFLRLFEMIFLMFLIDLTYIFVFSKNVFGISKNLIFLGLILTFLSSLTIILSIIFPKFISKIVLLISKIPLIKKFIKAEKIENWFHELDEVIKKIFREHKILLFLDIIMMFFLLMFQSYVFFYALNVFTPLKASFIEFFATVNIVNAVAFLVPTPGASGSFELVFTNALTPFASDKELIIKGVLFFRFLSYYLVLAIGTLILFLPIFKKTDNSVEN
ncbi:MAG: glycosyltransferase 2 family protein [Thermosipho sp. (in: thermotogales)]|nr:glycosyltransferase 2 family protein [Thermosipho sp. (in: thermotogales)]